MSASDDASDSTWMAALDEQDRGAARRLKNAARRRCSAYQHSDSAPTGRHAGTRHCSICDNHVCRAAIHCANCDWMHGTTSWHISGICAKCYACPCSGCGKPLCTHCADSPFGETCGTCKDAVKHDRERAARAAEKARIERLVEERLAKVRARQ
jgi:hypothetical protein